MTELLDWKALRLFCLYRTIFSGVLVTLLVFPKSRVLPDPWLPDLFGAVALLYFVFSIGFGFSVSRWERSHSKQFGFHIVLDLAALSLLGLASGDPTGIYAIWMIVPVSFAGFWQPGLRTQLYAVLAILSMLGTTLVHQWLTGAAYPVADLGALSVTQLVIALVSGVLKRNVADTHRIAGMRELDLASMVELNTFIVQRMEEGVVVVDEEGRIKMINPAAEQLFKAGAEEYLYQHLSALSPALNTALGDWRAGQPVRADTLKPLRLQITATGSGREQKALLLLEDTEGRDSKVQREKLAALGRLTASLAHEIRNPLGAISHSAQLLVESANISEQDKKLVNIVLGQSQRMNRLVEEILTLSRRKHPMWQELQLERWIKQLEDEWRLSWPTLSAHLRVSVDSTGAPFQVRVDVEHLRQLVILLVENATVHGVPQQGDLSIGIKVYRSGNTATPCIDISDNGPGIDKEMEQRIYEPFFTTRSGGSGLGLYLARELCEANYCELRYSPVPTGGSCFTISFPMARSITISQQ